MLEDWCALQAKETVLDSSFVLGTATKESRTDLNNKKNKNKKVLFAKVVGLRLSVLGNVCHSFKLKNYTY